MDVIRLRVASVDSMCMQNYKPGSRGLGALCDTTVSPLGGPISKTEGVVTFYPVPWNCRCIPLEVLVSADLPRWSWSVIFTLRRAQSNLASLLLGQIRVRALLRTGNKWMPEGHSRNLAIFLVLERKSTLLPPPPQKKTNP